VNHAERRNTELPKVADNFRASIASSRGVRILPHRNKMALILA
jgi:hypothetical protein